jgi:hypothetical protein
MDLHSPKRKMQLDEIYYLAMWTLGMKIDLDTHFLVEFGYPEGFRNLFY